MAAKQITSLARTMFTNIDNDLKDKTAFKTLEQKTGIKPSHACVGLVFVICFFSVLDIGGDILTTLFGMIYPAYRSFKALERKDEEQKKLWLTYWIIFGMLTTADDLFWRILHYIPGFYALRFLIYVWMFYPRANNGSVIIYNYIRPQLYRLKNKIENNTQPSTPDIVEEKTESNLTKEQ